MARVLVVDDDKNTLKFVRLHLEEEGYDVIEATDGRDALKKLKILPCDIAVVDVMMPFMDGISLTKEIRNTYEIPIIILTAKDQIDDKAVGFEAGTDDYLTKPFETKELAFRIKALLRRYVDPESDNDPIRLGNVLIIHENYSIKIDTKTIKLPLKEFELLYLLAKNSQRVFSREQIIENVWDLDFEGDNRTVDVHIKRLRQRFSHLSVPFSIRTVRGVGYTLEMNQ
ncbi:response regulator transcription factor [Salinicoccus sp. ID82-1]|uniref:response regulator transcription factor n=1 Tax=Salinicoccus sp. ID82-1 TaxID=2820269 RepID=UPI001F266E73|nr:response regulator transcription factor [Salinicoccus sp. ID82-1]MCG1009676.1 response regulator transcription factor [Salinicoccus sp. ID82-1]